MLKGIWETGVQYMLCIKCMIVIKNMVCKIPQGGGRVSITSPRPKCRWSFSYITLEYKILDKIKGTRKQYWREGKTSLVIELSYVLIIGILASILCMWMGRHQVLNVCVIISMSVLGVCTWWIGICYSNIHYKHYCYSVKYQIWTWNGCDSNIELFSCLLETCCVLWIIDGIDLWTV